MKRRFLNSGVRAGAVAMALVLGSSGVMLNSTTVVSAQENSIVQEAAQAEDSVISESTVWKYLDNNTDPAVELASRTAWTEKDFDDTAWKSAAGKFGAKKGELVTFDGFTPTVLLQQYIEGTTTDVPTFFFRTKFNIENLEDVASITGTLYHDDGVVVYLNGHEIFRSGMTVKDGADPTATNMYYAGENGGAPKEANVTVTAEQVKEYAVTGENVLAVELHNDRATSSDIYFGFAELKLNKASDLPQETTQKSVILNVGSDESSRNLTWYADTDTAGEVQYALKASAADGEFPAEYQTVTAGVTAANDAGFYSNQATIGGLQENTEYVYRVKNGETVSDIYSFKTGTFDGTFNFAFVGDPQIGAGSTDSDIVGWNETLNVMESYLNPEFLLSAGDQVNTASNEVQYTGYLNSIFASLPSATTIGNHDSGSAAYNEHFNLPNESEKGGTTAGTDYWFVYGNTLFMNINSNNRSNAEHKAFMEEAIAANKDVKWKTVVFHHSVYSTASHWDDSDIIDRRNELPQIFDELDIDVVLMGHDHVYTRTYMMNGFTPDTSEGVQSEVTDPTGILYLTANSASGSKYYNIANPEADYSAKMDQSKRRTVTNIEVTDTSYKMTTYYADDMSVLDTFTINKSAEEAPKADKTVLEEVITKADEIMKNEADYTVESWTLFKAAYDEAKTVDLKEDAAQEEVDAAEAALVSAMKNLVKAEENNSGNNNGGDNNSGSNNNGSSNSGNNSGSNNSGSSNSGSSNNGNNSGSSNNGNNSGNNSGNNNSGSNNSGSNSGSNNSGSKTTSVKTGDTADIAGISVLLAAAGSIIAFITAKRKLISR